MVRSAELRFFRSRISSGSNSRRRLVRRVLTAGRVVEYTTLSAACQIRANSADPAELQARISLPGLHQLIDPAAVEVGARLLSLPVDRGESTSSSG